MSNARFHPHKFTQRSYDRISRWYDLFSGSEEGICEKALDLLSPFPGERILEIGFGTGHTLPYLASQVGVRGKIAGTDLSPGMARMAKNRLVKEKRAGQVLLSVGDATNLPYPDQSFDGVLATFTIELFDDAEIPRVLQECWRVLHAGGRIVIASLQKPASTNRVVATYEWFHRAFPRLIDCHPILVQQVISQAGFEMVDQVIVLLWGLPVCIGKGRK